ncbi:MAG: glycosyl hydrolase 53 family protein [Infirmifilum sp.]
MTPRWLLLAVFSAILLAIVVTLIVGVPHRATPDESNDAIAIMASYGANCFRLRLFVNPKPRDEWGGFTGNNLSYTLLLARRVKAAGARLILDIHYSDTWADPGRQETPKEWENLSYPELLARVYNYTRTTLEQFIQAGAYPDIVQIGNEVSCGFLWPYGKICGIDDPESQWNRFALLLKTAAQAVRDSAPNAKIAIHIPATGWETTLWFFSNLEQRGVPFDVIALSYYPWWHGTLEKLRENVEKASRTFGKEVLIVETAYPYKPVNLSALPWSDASTAVWSLTPEGQRQYLIDIASTLNGTGCIGIIWWEPTLIPTPGLSPWLGGATALFDEEGKALPALRSMAEVRRILGEGSIIGGDISSLAELERLGKTFKP